MEQYCGCLQSPRSSRSYPFFRTAALERKHQRRPRQVGVEEDRSRRMWQWQSSIGRAVSALVLRLIGAKLVFEVVKIVVNLSSLEGGYFEFRRAETRNNVAPPVLTH